MTHVILLAMASALLLAAGSFTGKLAWDHFAELRRKSNYSYVFFTGSPYLGSEASAQDATPIRSKLDAEKRRADGEWIKSLGSRSDLDRVRRVNDYAFRLLRDIYEIQEAWRKNNGRYFQGKYTMEEVPSFRDVVPVRIGSGLTDQVDNWRDIGYLESYAPVRFKCDVYEGPQGHGFIVTIETNVDGSLWRLLAHHGEEERDVSNFRWERFLADEADG